jgi:hypothetical protein
LSYDFEDSFDSIAKGEKVTNLLKPLVPLRLKLSVLEVVNAQNEDVKEDNGHEDLIEVGVCDHLDDPTPVIILVVHPQEGRDPGKAVSFVVAVKEAWVGHTLIFFCA